MSDINAVPETPDVAVEVIAELTSPVEAAAPAGIQVADLHHIHSGFLTVSVREGIARLEELIAKLES